jgi:hypothetical protein
MDDIIPPKTPDPFAPSRDSIPISAFCPLFFIDIARIEAYKQGIISRLGLIRAS